MHPILIEFGPWPEIFSNWIYPLKLHAYGFFLALGFIAAIITAVKIALFIDFPAKEVIRLGERFLVVGLLGSRFLYIIVNIDTYINNPWLAIQLWKGGLVWYGGVLAAIGYGVWYARRNDHEMLVVTDIFAPALALGHSIGRVGCFMAGCCYGKITDSLFGVQFPIGSLAHKQQVFDGIITVTQAPLKVHPTQLYEAIAELLIALVLMRLMVLKIKKGTTTAGYLIGYGLVRFSIEFFRGDTARGFIGNWPLSTSQLISGTVILGGIVLIWYRNKKNYAK